MMIAVPRSSRTMPPKYAKRSERMSGAIRGLRSFVLKISWTTTLPQVCATFLSPFQGLLPDFTLTQGLRPGLQSVAASRLIGLSGLGRPGRCDGCHNGAGSFFFVPKMVHDSKTQNKLANPGPVGAEYCSPGRKSWVNPNKRNQVPKGRQKLQRFLSRIGISSRNISSSTVKCIPAQNTIDDARVVWRMVPASTRRTPGHRVRVASATKGSFTL